MSVKLGFDVIDNSIVTEIVFRSNTAPLEDIGHESPPGGVVASKSATILPRYSCVQ